MRAGLFTGLLCATLVAHAQTVQDRETWRGRPIEQMLGSLRRSGTEVIYSSELVKPSMVIETEPPPGDLVSRVRSVLASRGLMLEPIAPNYFSIRIAPSADAVTTPVGSREAMTESQLDEVAVYASRYTLTTVASSGAMALSAAQIDEIPGTHDDALRAMKALPGVAASLSARPHVRGALQSDVLVLFDGVPLADPFHFKQLQNLVSAFDPDLVSRVEVYSGGYPVRFGRRSDGVIELAPREATASAESTFGASLLTAHAASVGHLERWPVEWLIGLRRSTVDLLPGSVASDFGTPTFADTLGRMVWRPSAQTAWTLGWLTLNDQLELTSDDPIEHASARYRDEYIWLRHAWGGGEHDSLSTLLAFTHSDRARDGQLNDAGAAVGELAEERGQTALYARQDMRGALRRVRWSAGWELERVHAERDYKRRVEFAGPLAEALDVSGNHDVLVQDSPRGTSYSAYMTVETQLLRALDGELGMRFDEQSFPGSGSDSALSPRLHLRYTFSPRLTFRLSLGRFAQIQSPDEWRSEDAQLGPDPMQIARHSILGLSYQPVPEQEWRLEIYRKEWEHVNPYFDNLFDPWSLVPDLQMDRVRIAPDSADTRGVELSYRVRLTDEAAVWGSVSAATVSDAVAGREVSRSWDQRHSLAAGLTWQRQPWSVSGILRFHSGWPRTTVETPSDGDIRIGERNAARWRSFVSLDARGSWSKPLSLGSLEAWIEISNATNYRNRCCLKFNNAAGPNVQPYIGDALPILFNMGVDWHLP